ncbi:uncharacterized protein LOC119193488 isoform X3 [Manduca sexta]|uniref:uncharacterized protein LOC119193488 isoform X3 n=1 Tax=Manduca sexta TaxID=7130 RepID=UPI00188FD376|nr:uncharacterized protein LOC119193488 isoform X3 [Manduca sexta]
MLKACWDCIAGDRTHSESPYGTQLTGDIHRAPPWPRPRNEKETMLLLPKSLDSEDEVVVTGNLEGDARTLTIGLVTGMSEPDYQNVACQLDVNFPSNGANNIAIKVIQNGNHELVNDGKPATDYFIEGEEFIIRFRVRNENYISIYVGPSFLEQVELKHNVNDIRFLAVNGDVKIKSLNMNLHKMVFSSFHL